VQASSHGQAWSQQGRPKGGLAGTPAQLHLLLELLELAGGGLGSDELVSDDLVSDVLVGDELVSDDLASDDLASDDLVSDELASDDLVSDELASDDLVSDELASDDLVGELGHLGGDDVPGVLAVTAHVDF